MLADEGVCKLSLIVIETMNLYEKIFPKDKNAGVWILADPDGHSLDTVVENVRIAEREGAAVILAGGSLLRDADFDHAVKTIKSSTSLPVVLFPGSSRQVSAHADGILFTSLLSGRNPQYLIGEQVMAAPVIMSIGLEAVPTAYLLIESGSVTSAQYISNTSPIPRNKPEIAVAHAQAAYLFGMKAVYLEAGSGAGNPVPPEMVAAVAKHVPIPVIAGGGIRSPEQALAALKAGAKAIVVGTAVEEGGGKFIRELMIEIRHAAF